MSKSKDKLLVAVIADPSTVTGMLLTGIGERNAKGQQNWMIVEKDTDPVAIKTFFKATLDREDVGCFLVSQNVAEECRDMIVSHNKIYPTILEIPAKESVYDAEKDTIVMRAAAVLWGSETGSEKIKEITASLASGNK